MKVRSQRSVLSELRVLRGKTPVFSHTREASCQRRSCLTRPSLPCFKGTAFPRRLAVQRRTAAWRGGFLHVVMEGGFWGANCRTVAIARLASDCRAGRSGLRRRGRSRRRADSVRERRGRRQG